MPDELRCRNPRCNRVLEHVPKYCSTKCQGEARAYRRNAVLARLREGPATARELAAAVWGDEDYTWPPHWQNAISNTIWQLRKNTAIDTSPAVYELTEPTAADQVHKHMTGS